MHAGLSLVFQNLDGQMSDAEMYRHELALAARAEDVGFDSVWTPEHHFSDYQLTPNVPQFLAWVAGQTTPGQARHDGHGAAVARPGARGRELLAARPPVRRAGDPRARSRPRADRVRRLPRRDGRVPPALHRVHEAILDALENGFIEYDGELYQQPRIEIRPRPLASFKGRTFASAISPQSMDLMAELGVGLMVIAQKPWETVEEELATYRRRYVEINGVEPSKPILCVFVGVSHDPAEAQRMRDVYLQRYARSTVEHYQFADVVLRRHRGLRVLRRPGPATSRSTASRSSTASSPTSRCGARPTRSRPSCSTTSRRTDAGAVLTTLSYGGMPPDVAAANYDLFAARGAARAPGPRRRRRHRRHPRRARRPGVSA